MVADIAGNPISLIVRARTSEIAGYTATIAAAPYRDVNEAVAPALPLIGFGFRPSSISAADGVELSVQLSFLSYVVREEAPTAQNLDATEFGNAHVFGGDDFAVALNEFNGLVPELRTSRADEVQERFFFTRVRPFIGHYGRRALQLLDDLFSDSSLPATARYYYPYLLGHLDDQVDRPMRLAYLTKYAASLDKALRLGATDAFEYLSS